VIRSSRRLTSGDHHAAELRADRLAALGRAAQQRGSGGRAEEIGQATPEQRKQIGRAHSVVDPSCGPHS
jgi:hypothetical protein